MSNEEKEEALKYFTEVNKYTIHKSTTYRMNLLAIEALKSYSIHSTNNERSNMHEKTKDRPI